MGIFRIVLLLIAGLFQGFLSSVLSDALFGTTP